jgi:hypothetical protein
MRVIRRAPNPHWVYCLMDKDKPLVPVAVRPRDCDKLIGKPIYVDVITDKNGTTYRYEALGR